MAIMLDAHILILPQHVLHIELTVTRHIMLRRNIRALLHGLSRWSFSVWRQPSVSCICWNVSICFLCILLVLYACTSTVSPALARTSHRIHRVTMAIIFDTKLLLLPHHAPRREQQRLWLWQPGYDLVWYLYCIRGEMFVPVAWSPCVAS
jgi:hypothetical protein